jgi:cyanophycin synthetase
LQKRRRAEALPLSALQLTAEAASRGVPAFLRRDGMLQLGYGARSWAFDPSEPKTSAGTLAPDDIGLGPPPFARAAGATDVPWERIGPIPIVAVTGGSGRDTAAQLIARALAAQGQAVRLATAADFDATQALLADQSTTIAVVGLASDGVAARGLAFERCAYSAVVGLPADPPPGTADRTELARVLGVPMLITDPQGAVALDADTAEIAALGEYAPGPAIYISTSDQNPAVGFHRAAGGRALFVRDGTLIAAHGPSEHALITMALPSDALHGSLAALALLSAMGLTWEQIVAATRDM